jgi:hypothetical protein
MGWALKIETCSGPEIAINEPVPFGPKKAAKQWGGRGREEGGSPSLSPRQPFVQNNLEINNDSKNSLRDIKKHLLLLFRFLK